MNASVPFQPTQFQELKGLDLNLVLTNLVEGDLFENVNAHLFDTNRLPVHARESYVDELKKTMRERFGEQQGISDWFIDTITDPFVILTALFVPGAAGQLMKGVGGVFRPITGNFIRENAPLFGQAGLLSGFQLYRNAPQISEAALAIRNEQKNILQRNAEILIPERQKIVARLNEQFPEINISRGLDPQNYVEGSQARQVLEDINDAVYSRLYGLDRNVAFGARIREKTAFMDTLEYQASGEVTRKTTKQMDHRSMEDIINRAERDNTILKDLEDAWGTDGNPITYNSDDGSFTWQVDDKTFQRVLRPGSPKLKTVEDGWEQLVSDEWVDQIYRKYGLDSYSNSIRQVLDEDFMRLFGKDSIRATEGASSALARLTALADKVDEASNLERLKIVRELIDPDKFMRLYKAQGLKMTGSGKETVSEDYIRSFFNSSLDDISKTVDPEKIEGLTNEIVDLVAQQSRRGSYFPSSATQLLDETGHIQKSPKRMRAAAGRETISPTGAIFQKTRGVPILPMEFLERAKTRAADAGGKSRRLIENIERAQRGNRKAIRKAFEGPDGKEMLRQGGIMGVNPNVERTLVRHLNGSSQTYALHIAGVNRDAAGNYVYNPAIWKHITEAQRGYAKNLPIEERDTPMFGWDGEHRLSAEARKRYLNDPVRRGATISTVFEEAGELTPEGGFSLVDVLEQGFVSAGNNFDRYALRDVLFPRMLGRKSLDRTTADITALYTKQIGRKFVEGPLGTAVRNKGGRFGKWFVDNLDVWSNPENIHMGRGAATGNLTKYLYATHLGANPASVMLNLFQPLLLTAPWAGADVTAKAYASAFKEMGSYIRERSRSGKLFQTPAEKEALIRKHFKHADEMDISPNIFENIDALTEMGKTAGKSTAHNFFFDLPMKAFEKGEWFNRAVAAHTVDALYAKAAAKGAFKASDFAKGGSLYSQKLRDTRDMVVETQFGSGEWNTPLLFIDQFKTLDEGIGLMKGISYAVSNPLIRQFTQFPTRMFTAGTYIPSQVGGGKRYLREALGGGEVNKVLGPFAPVVVDTMRGLGMSAVAYHAAKDLFGVELERGLYGEAVGGIPRMVVATMNGEEFDRFSPPFLDMALNLGKWATGSDKAAFANFTSRLIPGGIAMNRAMGIASDQTGKILGGLTTQFQKTYVDWDNPTSDGYVPMYKGDGTLIDYQEPTEVILSGLGLDMGALKAKQSDLSAYLSSQREDILERRRAYLQKLFANDVSGANDVAADFEEVYKIPLTITKRHLDAYAKSRIIPRDERILDRMPTDMRHLYARLVAGRGPNMGLPPEAFELPTATKRSEQFRRPELHVNSTALAEMRRIIEDNARRKGKAPPTYWPPFYGE